jgi:hypothetical protein
MQYVSKALRELATRPFCKTDKLDPSLPNALSEQALPVCEKSTTVSPELNRACVLIEKVLPSCRSPNADSFATPHGTLPVPARTEKPLARYKLSKIDRLDAPKLLHSMEISLPCRKKVRNDILDPNTPNSVKLINWFDPLLIAVLLLTEKLDASSE